MKNLGRLRRDARKVAATAKRASTSKWGTKQIRVNVTVERWSNGRYIAGACIGTHGLKPGRRLTPKGRWYSTVDNRCGHSQKARTPQSAVAKALKSLSATVAKRGRR